MRAAFIFALILATPLAGQQTERPEIALGSAAEDRLRLEQLLGVTAPEGYLIRSFSSLNTLPAERSGPRLDFIRPSFRVVRNSSHPYSLNQGALWTGRGVNAHVAGGARFVTGPFQVTLVPQVMHMENRDVQVVPSTAPGRSTFASPWYSGDRRSMDLPLRFGNDQITMFDLGQSSATFAIDPVVVGIATENQWWGPGIRNAIVMSNNAAGIPHLFASTSRPLETDLGAFEAKWMIGGVTESTFFDTLSTNDLRSLSGVAITFAPRFEPNLSVGIARAVLTATADRASIPARSLDFITRWGDTGDSDQLTSFFFRWIFPADHVETYAEWTRLEAPGSLRSFLAAPHHTQGYTLGVQWARPVRGSHAFRLQGEVTNLEISSALRGEETSTFYVGRNVEHGYTHRGQVIGAAIGPGSSGQWMAADYLAPAWQLGIFGGRIRWETDAYYRQPTGFSFYSHDVSLFGGIRASGHLLGSDLAVELTNGYRYNYLFQNHTQGWGPDALNDRRNWTLEFALTPGTWHRSPPAR